MIFLSMEKHINNFRLFVLAELLTVTFITLLQITNVRYFLVFLVLMHTGIALFVISKKRFLKSGLNVIKYYKNMYRYLALYLPILAYKLPSYLFEYTVNHQVIVGLTLTVTTIVVSLSILNTLALKRALNSQLKG